MPAWSDEHMEHLRTLAKQGLSASSIAFRLNDKFGTSYSRNAVIGRMARGNVAFANKQPYAGKPKTERKRPWESVELPEMPAAPKNAITLLELQPHQCRWPFGNGPILFCGGSAVEGMPYCAGHCRVAYQPPKRAT